MLKHQLFRIIIGVITILFSSYALITHNINILLLPSVQFIFGLITATTLVSGVSAFREKRIGLGFFFIFETLFMFTVILLNNTMRIEGLTSVLVMYIVCGVPIGVLVMFAHRLETKSKL